MDSIELTEEQLCELAGRIATALPDRMAKILYSESEAAVILSISPLTLRNWRQAGKVPSATKGRPALYRREHIEEAARFIETRAAG